MTDKVLNTTIEILGKFYSIRCLESELKNLQSAAQYLNEKMLEVQESGKTINLERIAIITALNITHQMLQQDNQKNSLVNKINQKLNYLQERLDKTIKKPIQTELIYREESSELQFS